LRCFKVGATDSCEQLLQASSRQRNRPGHSQIQSNHRCKAGSGRPGGSASYTRDSREAVRKLLHADDSHKNKQAADRDERVVWDEFIVCTAEYEPAYASKRDGHPGKDEDLDEKPDESSA
jgi:hypothetical protein